MNLSARAFTHEAAATSSLLDADREELWQLYRRHYDAPRTALDTSLSRSTIVVRVRHRATGALCGMTVFSVRAHQHRGISFFLVWGGAAAFDRECRGKWLLERAALRLFFLFRLHNPLAPLFLIGESNAFQSYRALARSFAEFWPHPTRPTPPWERSFMDGFAAQRFGEAWDPQRGVVRALGKTIRRESSLTATATTDPLLRFFQQQNPSASLGEAMIFFAPIHRRNIVTMVTRGLRAHLR